MPRYAARTDANHEAIRKLLRSMLQLVEDTSAIGGGFPDLLVTHGGITCAVEVKDGAKPPSARKLTPDEQRWRARWEAAGGRYAVIESEGEAELLARNLRILAGAK